jgi:hypothetical protein
MLVCDCGWFGAGPVSQRKQAKENELIFLRLSLIILKGTALNARLTSFPSFLFPLFPFILLFLVLSSFPFVWKLPFFYATMMNVDGGIFSCDKTYITFPFQCSVALRLLTSVCNHHHHLPSELSHQCKLHIH